MPVFIVRDFSRLTFGQRIIAGFVLIATVILAALLGLVILYIAAVLIVIGAVAALCFSLYRRFFSPKRPRRDEGMTIHRTSSGIIIDVEPDRSEDHH